MSRQVSELEQTLQQLVAEHRRLLADLEAQQAAMRTMDAAAVDAATRRQEQSRMRILALDTRRKLLSLQLAKVHRITADPTLAQLAELYPAYRVSLLKLRQELKDAVLKVNHRATVAGKVAAAVLGHLNTVIRIFAGAVERAGLYTKAGVPRMAARVGVMEAVA
jgi:hypothetical protein